MSILDLIFGLDCGGLSRRSDEDEAPPSSARLRYDAPPTECECNNCGRTFSPIWLNHWCPARCGGRIYCK